MSKRKINYQLDKPILVQTKPFEFNLSKNWVRMSLVTMTMIAGFTVSTTMASAKEQISTTTTVINEKTADTSAVAPQDAVTPTHNSDDTTGGTTTPAATNGKTTAVAANSNNDMATSQVADAQHLATKTQTAANSETVDTTKSLQPATDVNGHSLDLDSVTPKSTVTDTDVSITNAPASVADNTVVKDANGNYWTPVTPVTDPTDGKTTKDNTYTQLTDYTYTQNNDSDATYTITGYTGDLQKYLAGSTKPQDGDKTINLTLPKTYNGNLVTAIGANAFADKNISGEVVIPDSIISIGDGAFKDNQISGNITIPNSVVNFGDNIFANNKITSVKWSQNWYTGQGTFENNQITDLDLGSGVTVIGNDAFKGNQLTTLTLPSQIGQINMSAFQDNQLTAVNFDNANKLNIIDTNAFLGNHISGTVTIPASVTLIGDNVFSKNEINTLVLSGNQLQKIGNDAFSVNQISGEIDIPASVINIGINAFTQNGINKLNFSGNSLQTIGTDAFSLNQISGEVNIPSSVTSIGDRAFTQNGINTLKLNNGLINIGTDAFAHNQIGGEVDIPDSVTEIGVRAFANNGINTLKIGSGITNINTGVFSYNQIGGEVDIPNTVTHIGDEAFTQNGINTLKLGHSVQTIGTDAFSVNQISGEVEIPNTVTSIGTRAFTQNLINTLTLGDQVVTINDDAFSRNQIKGTLTIPDSVTDVGENAFANNLISKLVLGNNISTIGLYAFDSNAINQIMSTKSLNAGDYLRGQQAWVVAAADASGNQIRNVKSAIEAALRADGTTGFTLPDGDNLTFVDQHDGQTWQYDAATDTLTDPNGQITSTQAAFQFSSNGLGSYGTTELILNLAVANGQSAPAIHPTTITVNYETPDGHLQGTTTLVGNPGTKYDSTTILNHIPAGWRLSTPLGDLPQENGITDQTVTIQLTPKEEAQSAPAVYPTTITVNYETPDGHLQGTTTLVGNPGTKYDSTTILDHIPAGWQLSTPLGDLPQENGITNQTVTIQLTPKEEAQSAPAVYPTTITVNYETPDGHLQGTTILVGNPGTKYDSTTILNHIPAGWRLSTPLGDLPQENGITDQTVTIQLTPKEEAQSAPAIYPTTITLNYETPDGQTRGTTTLVGNPGTKYDSTTILDHIPAGWQLGTPLGRLPQLEANTTNQLFVISLAAQEKTQVGAAVHSTLPPENNSTATSEGTPAPVKAGTDNSKVKRDTPISEDNPKSSETTTATNKNDAKQRKIVQTQGYSMPVTADNRDSQVVEQEAAASVIVATQAGNDSKKQVRQTTTKGSSVVNSSARLPQTNDNSSFKSTFIGALLLSLLSWLGFTRRKHEQD
ncbi:hypothetical protein IWT140_00731 [Secundilactobacillus pentosiphilus]|uniref:Gram-positive cocci surface proteins LPxTG domain-containing protein n=1 Tax=Secundilactobacillus pentosiphilus TaxID=1714682 RepID=A0A1Z5INH6_9LACO|nr:leucine-rich repeat protein [Secundilactobacillus pentosiphilus]GAX03132.1 hypothetical protein IWT140_00731 [Secundilactobacillus pentosiphilus]